MQVDCHYASLYVIGSFSLISNVWTSSQCNVTMKNMVDGCVYAIGGKLFYQKLPSTVIENTYKANHTEKCVNKEICKKNFTVSRLNYKTFSSIIHEIVMNMIHRCCGGCTNVTVLKHIHHVSDEEFEDSSDIIYPVIGKSTLDELYDYNFIPVLKPLESYYFSLKPSNTEVMKNMITTCFKMWPLLVISLLFSFIFGFIIWGSERKNNPDEFPEPFPSGMFEGFWWSFVSMTTVGYGDKAPKSILGRLFAIIWVLIGITIIAVYTANLTTFLMSFRSDLDTGIKSKSVGVLGGRLDAVASVVELGGIPFELKHKTTVDGIIELTKLVHEKRISGFLLNVDTYQYFSRIILSNGRKDVENNMRQHLIQTQKRVTSNSFAYGILFKNMTDYKYYKKYLKHNRMLIEACYTARSNNKSSEIKLGQTFSADHDMFKQFLIYSLTVLGVLSIFGASYEIYNRYYKSKKVNTINVINVNECPK